MQIDVGTVIGAIGILLSLFLTVYSGLLRYTIARRDEENARRFSVLETENKELRGELKAACDRLRLDELETERLRGRIAVIEATQSGISQSVDEMRRQQVPRAEWERQIKTIEGQLATIMGQLTQLVGHRPSNVS